MPGSLGFEYVPLAMRTTRTAARAGAAPGSPSRVGTRPGAVGSGEPDGGLLPASRPGPRCQPGTPRADARSGQCRRDVSRFGGAVASGASVCALFGAVTQRQGPPRGSGAPARSIARDGAILQHFQWVRPISVESGFRARGLAPAQVQKVVRWESLGRPAAYEIGCDWPAVSRRHKVSLSLQ